MPNTFLIVFKTPDDSCSLEDSLVCLSSSSSKSATAFLLWLSLSPFLFVCFSCVGVFISSAFLSEGLFSSLVSSFFSDFSSDFSWGCFSSFLFSWSLFSFEDLLATSFLSFDCSSSFFSVIFLSSGVLFSSLALFSSFLFSSGRGSSSLVDLFSSFTKCGFFISLLFTE